MPALGPGNILPVLPPDHEIIDHAHRGKIQRILVKHADAMHNRIRGVGNLHRPVIQTDFTLIGLDKTRQDFHQSAFAGPVLTQDALDRTRRDGEGDVIIGMYRAEMFVDVGELNFHNLA